MEAEKIGDDMRKLLLLRMNDSVRDATGYLADFWRLIYLHLCAFSSTTLNNASSDAYYSSWSSELRSHHHAMV